MTAHLLGLLLALAPVPADSPAPPAPKDSSAPATASPAANGLAPAPADSPDAPAPSDSPQPPPSPAPVPADSPGAPPSAAPAEPGEMSASLTEGPVAVTAKISPDDSQVGDLIKLELTAAYPAGYTVNLPLSLRFDPLHLVSVDEAEPESTGQGFRKVFTITLQHFAVGDAKVPAFPLTHVGPDGAVQTVQVPPTPFTVRSLLANEPDPKRQGEDPPVSLEYPNRRAEIIIYSALAALLVGLVGGLLFARWRRRPRALVLPPPIPAHVVAYQQLDELQKAELVARGEYQDYYLQLTEIAKGYLEGRFGIDALDRTTDELRRVLERAAPQIAPLKPTDLVRFLQACDLVKFARFAPPGEEAVAALEEVRNMVAATVPQAASKDSSPPAASTAAAAAGTPSAGTASAGTSPSAGTPSAGTSAAGTSSAGTPSTGTPSAGTPPAGTSAAGTPPAGTSAASDTPTHTEAAP